MATVPAENDDRKYLAGAFALRFKDRLHLIMGFSAGALIAVAFFDLLPEAKRAFFCNIAVTSLWSTMP